MALAANALTTVAEMESVLGLASGSATSKLQRVINQASAIAETFTSRTLYRTTNISEKHAGTTGPLLLLERAPINSITSVSYLGSALASTDYEVYDSDQGIIYKISGVWEGIDYVFGDTSETIYTGNGRKVWTIVYDGGWYTPAQEDATPANTRALPYDIEHACIQIAVHLYRNEGRDALVQSESLLDGSQSFKNITTFGGAQWLAQAVPGAAAILDRYKRGYFG